MKYISVCSGIEAATVAWAPLGWEPVAFAEIDAFPSAVLAHHYPGVPNLGDITKVDWSVYHGQADIVIGGTPCQSFSLAGNRGGADDVRGGLSFEFVRLVRAIRPRWFVWENVFGVLSSDSGEFFAKFLSALDECGYFLAWRVLDAQYFGVPQRRRRLFVIGHLGGWQFAAGVLFDADSVCGDFAPLAKAGEDDSRAVTECDGGPSGDIGDDASQLYECASRGHSAPKRVEKAPCVLARPQNKGHLVVTRTLPQAPARERNSLAQHNVSEAATALAVGPADDDNTTYVIDGPARTLRTGQNRQPIDITHSNFAVTCGRVRYLTPKECERLMGLPDDYTLVPYRGGLARPTPRYKAIGNSMAVPVVRWIGQRITDQEKDKS